MKDFLLAAANAFIRVAALVMLPGKKRPLSPESVRRILVYGQMGIGNMIMFTPFLKALRGYFPEARIRVLFLMKNGAEQVLEGSGLVDEIVIWNHREQSYRQRWQAIREIKEWKPDLIVSRFASRPVDYALIALLSRAPYRVGHVSSGGWKGRYDYLNNYPVKMKENMHEIDRYLLLAGELGIPAADKKTVFHISDDDEKAARAFLKAHDIGEDEPFVTIQMGTNPVQNWKRWDGRKWAALADNLRQNRVKIVAVGSADEKGLIEETFADLTVKPVIAAGELTLQQTAAVIRKSRLMICQDSGLMHVAAAVATPLVAIYGPTDYRRTAPPGDKHLIIRKELPCSPCLTMRGTARVEACRERVCLEAITVDGVLTAVRRQLNIPLAETPCTTGNHAES